MPNNSIDDIVQVGLETLQALSNDPSGAKQPGGKVDAFANDASNLDPASRTRLWRKIEDLKKRDHDFDDDFRLNLYQTYRDRIKHEDNLANQRTTYLLMSQAFLLAPYILSFTAQYQAGPLKALQMIVPLIAIATGISALMGVRAAHKAIDRTINEYEHLDGENNDPNSPIHSSIVKYGRLQLPLSTISESRSIQGLVPSLRSARDLDQKGWLLNNLLPIGIPLVWACFFLVTFPTHYQALLDPFKNVTVVLITVIILLVSVIGALYVWLRKVLKQLREIQNRQTS
jgi:hypothetical protein